MSVSSPLTEAQLQRARQRLGAIAALFCVVFTTAAFSGYVWFLVGGELLVRRQYNLFDLPSALLWAVLWAVLWYQPLSTRNALALGQASLLLICLVHNVLSMVNAEAQQIALPKITWAVIWIALYPLLVPSTVRTTLTVAGLGILTAPAGVAVAQALGRDIVPSDYLAVSVSHVVAGVIAFIGSDLVYRSAVDIAELREQQGLLDAILKSVGDAMVLRSPEGHVVFANAAAYKLLGQDLRSHDTLSPYLDARRNGLIVDATGTEPSSLLVSHRFVSLGGTSHTLVVIRRITNWLGRRWAAGRR